MGQPPWASPEQLEFLHGYTSGLDEEKKKNGLKDHYDFIAQQFILRWPVILTDKDRQKVGEGGDAQGEAVQRQTKVCSFFLLVTRYLPFWIASKSTSATKCFVSVIWLLNPSPSST
jgi:hypothetical protein